MNHKENTGYRKPQKDMRTKSKIHYFLKEFCNDELEINEQSAPYHKHFTQLQGKVIVSLWTKLDIHNTGVNIVSIYGKDQDHVIQKIIQVDTEGAFFYAHQGQKKVKLCHFESDKWYSFYFTVNMLTQTYSLYIDGELLLRNASFYHRAVSVDEVSIESYGGKSLTRHLFVYPSLIQSVSDAKNSAVILDAKELGVEADGQTVVTEQLQQLIDRCSVTGGTVYLKDGIYLTGCIEMKRNVTLYIDENAVLKGILDLDQYPVRLSETHPNWNTMVQGPQKSLIYGDNQENIQITGGGVIDGSGDFPGIYGTESERVSGILLVGCEHARIEEIYIKDAGMWTVPLVECDDMYIHDVNINSTWYPNRDGFDLCDCCDVLVENCNIKADDDAMCFKSGNESGCDNVTVRNCMIISTMANGIKFGTYSYGGFTNCICESCIVKDTRTCAIVIQCVDGGLIRNLQFHDIVIQNVESVFFILIADKGRTPSWGSHRIGSVSEVVFNHIQAEEVKRSYGSYLGGFAKDSGIYPISDILFKNVHVIYRGGVLEVPKEPEEFENQYPESNVFGILPAWGYYIRHAENVVFEGCDAKLELEDAREEIFLSDCSKVTVNGKVLAE